MACPTARCSAPRQAAPPGRNCEKRRRLVAASWRSSPAMLLISHCRASLLPLREPCLGREQGGKGGGGATVRGRRGSRAHRLGWAARSTHQENVVQHLAKLLQSLLQLALQLVTALLAGSLRGTVRLLQ